MIIPPHFLFDEEVFDRLHAYLDSIICTNVRLPKVPFKAPLKANGFEEFDWILSGEFWSTLQDFATHSGDHELIFSVLEPDPVNYFKETFGYYNWAILPSSLSIDDYWDFLNNAPNNSPADSILANAQVVVITAPSKRWAVWGERASGLCVLATVNNDKMPDWNNIRWLSALYKNKEWMDFSIEVAQQFELLDSDLR
ncbi:MAG: hypothetical protein CJBNEKGG_03315 [Prosthecobacter sp.]|nr:hypothetical protein [Prosthecobacter sp.]